MEFEGCILIIVEKQWENQESQSMAHKRKKNVDSGIYCLDSWDRTNGIYAIYDCSSFAPFVANYSKGCVALATGRHCMRFLLPRESSRALNSL